MDESLTGRIHLLKIDVMRSAREKTYDSVGFVVTTETMWLLTVC